MDLLELAKIYDSFGTRKRPNPRIKIYDGEPKLFDD